GPRRRSERARQRRPDRAHERARPGGTLTMDRRNFIRLSGVAAGGLLAARQRGAQAQEHAAHAATHGGGAHAHAHARDPAAGPPATTPATPLAVTRLREAGGAPAVITPNGSTLPLRVVDGVKVGHLIASPVQHTFAPGLSAECWGYNGGTPGPTIELIEGDRVRFYVTNRLPEPTTVHWHGLIVPNGMDGVAGLNQRPIPVGETYAYEFTV